LIVLARQEFETAWHDAVLQSLTGTQLVLVHFRPVQQTIAVGGTINPFL
jgi:hypothetical protein